MRFAWLMAALAGLWAMPAAAVTTITLTSPTSSQGVHQKVTLTGLTGSDVIDVLGSSGPEFLHFWWDYFPSTGTWLLDGNGGLVVTCATQAAGQCHDEFSAQSPAYPISIFATLDIKVVANEIFVDWSKSDNVNLCPGLAEADRIPGNANKCGFLWPLANAMQLSIDVTGPSANTFGYTVETVRSVVPEPASWALMIVGIGLIGAAVRRQRVLRPYAVGLRR